MGIDLHFQTNGKAASPPELVGEWVVILSPKIKFTLTEAFVIISGPVI
jgi:hypothetical protein